VACIASILEEVVQAASKKILMVLFSNRSKVLIRHLSKRVEGLNHKPVVDLQTSAARFQA